MKEKRLGIFIPLELIENPELDWINKILLTEILSLSKLKNGCTASNERLSEFLQIQKSSIHRRIKFLVENDYIITNNKFSGGKCIGRKIIPTGKLVVAKQKPMVAKQNLMVAQSSTMVAQETINGSTANHSMVAQSDPISSFINSDNSVINSVINSDSNSEELEKGLVRILEKLNIK